MSLFIILMILLIIIAISNCDTREDFWAKSVQITESNINSYITKYLANGISGPLIIDGSVDISGDITGKTINKLQGQITAVKNNANITSNIRETTVQGGGIINAVTAGGINTAISTTANGVRSGIW